ncbi:hypothetical protein [Bartonella australis]|uniref:hypothetical protein n=1 Tax=Bartonella australis TaxID=388640 RepID=UPI000346CBC9|nr:hypothetical protein [Bartonella australis]
MLALARFFFYGLGIHRFMTGKMGLASQCFFYIFCSPVPSTAADAEYCAIQVMPYKPFRYITEIGGVDIYLEEISFLL